MEKLYFSLVGSHFLCSRMTSAAVAEGASAAVRAKPAAGPLRVCPANRRYFASPADWVSPNHSGGWRDNPPAADGRKVVITDTDHLWGIGGNRAWVWKSFLRGANPIFMDPYDGVVLSRGADTKWQPVRRSMGHTLNYARRINLAAMTPRGKLASSGYCLARAAGDSAEYLVYLPAGGRVTVDLSAAAGELAVEWFDAAKGKAVGAPAVRGGARRTLKAPFRGEAVLYLRAKGGK